MTNKKLYEISEFNISTTYEIGDRFIYNGELYEVSGTTVKESIFPEAEIGCHKIPTFAVEPNAGKTKRFTNKYPDNTPDNTPVYYKYYLNGYHYEQGDFIEKLGQIEDIEEELGIDLITLFRALKNGVYYDIGSKTIRYYEIDGNQYIDIDIQDQFLNLMYASPYEDSCHCEMSLALNDYGKTWALTKEELEK